MARKGPACLTLATLMLELESPGHVCRQEYEKLRAFAPQLASKGFDGGKRMRRRLLAWPVSSYRCACSRLARPRNASSSSTPPSWTAPGACETVTPEDVKVQENGVEAKMLKVEAIEWTTKVQILLDNGSGIGVGQSQSAAQRPPRSARSAAAGSRGHASSPPLRSRASSCARRPIARQQLAGVDRLAPDSTAGRFVESLGEALQRFERDKTDFFGVIVSLGRPSGDNRVLDRDINQIFERAQKSRRRCTS